MKNITNRSHVTATITILHDMEKKIKDSERIILTNTRFFCSNSWTEVIISKLDIFF